MKSKGTMQRIKMFLFGKKHPDKIYHVVSELKIISKVYLQDVRIRKKKHA